MAMSTDPRFPDTISRGVCKIENADGTTIKDVVTAGVDGARVDHLFISSDDTSAMNVILYLNDGTNDVYLADVLVPIGSGSSESNRTVINVLSNTVLTCVDAGNKFYLKGGDKLRARVVASVTAGKAVYVTAILGDY